MHPDSGGLLLPYVICPTRGHRIGAKLPQPCTIRLRLPVHREPNPSGLPRFYVRLNVRKLTSTFVRQLTLLAAVGLLVAACGADAGSTTSPPPASEAASSPSAAVSPSELPIGVEQDLDAGSYALSDFPVGITFEIPAVEPPAQWTACSPAAVEQAACHWSNPAEQIPPEAVTFQIVDNVRTPPCSDQETAELLDPPVGPSVDDLVAAISDLEGYEATPPEDITVSGFSGKEFTLTAVSHGCGATWATADRTTGMGAGEVNLLRILDVDGERVMIAGAHHPETTPDATVAAIEQVMDSVQIQP